jgi:hypothetical protein
LRKQSKAISVWRSFPLKKMEIESDSARWKVGLGMREMKNK